MRSQKFEKITINIISRTGAIIFSRTSLGNTIKATAIAAIRNGVKLPGNVIFQS